MAEQWTRKAVSEEKARIKSELDGLGADRGSRLTLIMQQLRELSDAVQGKKALRRYVYSMSALVHSERFGGLKDSTINSLFENISAILKIQKIDASRSRLRHLYGEFYLVRSQLLRRRGCHWDSTWEELSAAKYIESQHKLHGLLATAIRLTRIGSIRQAKTYFSTVLNESLPSRQRFLAELGWIHACRIQGDFAQAVARSEKISEVMDLSERDQLELEWQRHCIAASSGEGLDAIIGAAGKNGSHHQAAYFIEAFLWTRAVFHYRDIDAFPKLASYGKTRLGAHHEGLFFKCALTIEECYNKEVSFEARLRKLGSLLSKRHELITLDKELLFLLAAATWLRRNNALAHAALVLQEYEALSMRVSEGKSRDCLHTYDDYYDKDWYLGYSSLNEKAKL